MRAGGKFVIGAAALGVSALSTGASAEIRMSAWGETPDHRKVDLYTLRNKAGLTVRIATYGGMLVDLIVPDRDGTPVNVIRGMDRLTDYFERHASLYGSIVGRYGNRIKGGRFTLDGVDYQLPVNNQGNTLHGGPIGFDQRIWTASPQDGAAPSLTLRYVSPDGEMGFPGAVKATVKYTLDGRDLRVDFGATSDRPTVIDLFVHPWFNLGGAGNGDILGHRLQIFASRYAEMDESHTPTGGLAPVAGTPFDFRRPIPIGTHIHDCDWQISGNPRAPGYDQQFALDGKAGTLRLAARLEEPDSGRVLEVLTTQPDLGLYTTNFPGTIAGRAGERYGQYGAVVFETQHFGNSPNLPQFPSTVLRPGAKFHEMTIFRFPAGGGGRASPPRSPHLIADAPPCGMPTPPHAR
ncbi:aldose epimerase family protein [Sphingomonas quercus]|uniref:Aldose 1-epimerase n=1 Tax=Sphingomonas quercus TaxID=2842451 RepID=A0ABS6BIZ7_9SPHN|nr:aldose epimerase family protein [Sphingomonas quercus]MBU3077406.1 galactose mutarotase [Sphingomonas quercus]